MAFYNRINTSFTHDAIEYKCELNPVDERKLPHVFHVYLNDHWAGTLTYDDGWTMEPDCGFTEYLGNVVMAWYG